MYSKIAINNVKKSFKDYTIYFLTLTFAVCIFYSFNSIGSQSIMADMTSGQASYVRLMEQLISIVSISVSVILGGLIIYATNFLINRRKKEFGIYMILGMSKRNMSKILFFETLYIGILSLVAGLALGMILAQILSVFTAKLFMIEMVKYSFVISKYAILKTILYFGIMYILVILFNVVVVSRYKLINLLSASRKNETVKIRSTIIGALTLIISIITLGIAYYLINKCGLNFIDNRFKVSIILGILGTLLFFYGIASVILSLIKKNKNIYLNSLNSFTLSQISSKFNTNFISMTIICLMLFVTIGTLTSGLNVKNSMENSLEKCTPFDASISVFYKGKNSTGSSEEAIKELGYVLGENDSYSIIREYEYNMSLKDLLNDYFINEDLKTFLEGPVFDKITLISISEYNNMRKLRGEPQVELKENEFLVASNYEILKETIEAFVKNTDVINIENKELHLKDKKIIDESFATSSNATTLFNLIVPDEFVKNLNVSEEVVNLNFNKDYENSAKNDISNILNDFRYNSSKYEKLDFSIYGQTREMAIEDSRGLSTLVLFIAVYIGIVFLLSSAAVLAIQQLSQCSDSVEKYISLRKIGATKKIINKSIFTQVITFFALPLALAVIHSVVGIHVVNNYVSALGVTNLFKPTLITILIMIIVYGGYFYATYISYKNIASNDYK